MPLIAGQRRDVLRTSDAVQKQRYSNQRDS